MIYSVTVFGSTSFFSFSLTSTYRSPVVLYSTFGFGSGSGSLTGVTTFLDTNGFVPVRSLKKLLPYTDKVMVDLKAMDPEIHIKLTGKDNSRVKETVRFLGKLKKIHSLRIPIIPGYTDTITNAIETARFISGIDTDILLHLLRFRPHGTSGPAQDWEPPSDDIIGQLVSAIEKETSLSVRCSR